MTPVVRPGRRRRAACVRTRTDGRTDLPRQLLTAVMDKNTYSAITTLALSSVRRIFAHYSFLICVSSRADPGLVNGGARSRRRRRRGGGVWEGGVPLPNGEGSGEGAVHWIKIQKIFWGGGCAPSPENFLNFYPKMAHFCAFCNLQQ